MANDRNINISIRTTADTSGATQAAAALEGVADASASVAQQTGGGGNSGAGESVFDAATAGAEALAEAAGNTAPALEQAGSSSRQTGAMMQNMGFQVADVAVQLEAGTSAARVFAQQGSQMLGVLGPWGAVAGAAVAIGGALISAGGNAEEANDKYLEALGVLLERLGEVEAAKAGAAQREWLDTLDDEEEAIRTQNSLLSDQLRILQARRAAQLSIADAERERKKAEIDANPKRSDAEKTAAKAALEEEGEMQKLREEVTKRGETLTQKRQLAQQMEEELARKTARQATVNQEAGTQESKVDKLQRKILLEEEKLKTLPELEEQTKGARSALSIAEMQGDTSIDASPEAKERIARFEDAQDAERRKKLLQKELESAQARLAETNAAQAALNKELEALRKDAPAARQEAETDYTVGLEEVRGMKGVYDQGRERRNIQTAQQVRDAEKAASDKKQKEEEDALRKERQREQREAQEKLRATADANELTITQWDNANGGGGARSRQRRQTGEPPLGNAKGGNDALKSLANDIGSADTTAEIAMVREAVKAKSAELGTAVVAALREMIGKQEQLVQQLNAIRERIRRLEGK